MKWVENDYDSHLKSDPKVPLVINENMGTVLTDSVPVIPEASVRVTEEMQSQPNVPNVPKELRVRY